MREFFISPWGVILIYVLLLILFTGANDALRRQLGKKDLKISILISQLEGLGVIVKEEPRTFSGYFFEYSKDARDLQFKVRMASIGYLAGVETMEGLASGIQEPEPTSDPEMVALDGLENSVNSLIKTLGMEELPDGTLVPKAELERIEELMAEEAQAGAEETGIKKFTREELLEAWRNNPNYPRRYG